MVDPPISEHGTPILRGQAAAVLENAHGLWLRAKKFALAHASQAKRKQKILSSLAKVTLITSMGTASVSAFGVVTTPAGVDAGAATLDVEAEPAAGGAPSTTGGDPAAPSKRWVWIATGVLAILTTASKTAEQLFGKPEDVPKHTGAEQSLDEEMRSLNVLGAQLGSYIDGAAGDGLKKLEEQLDVAAEAIKGACQVIAVTPTEEHEALAKAEVEGSRIDVALNRVRRPADEPDLPETAELHAVRRGGGVG
jgi:hypothetical protein